MTRHFTTFSFSFRGLTDTRFDLHSSLGLLNRNGKKKNWIFFDRIPSSPHDDHNRNVPVSSETSMISSRRCVSSFTVPSAIVLSNSSLLSPLPRSSRMEEKFDIYYFYFQRVREKLIFNLSYTCSRFSRFCCFASHFLLLFFPALLLRSTHKNFGVSRSLLLML